MRAQSEFTINRSQIRFLFKIKIRLEFKGAVINYDQEGGGGGGGSISGYSQKNFKPPPIQEIKIQTPSRFQIIISDPNTSLQEENTHEYSSFECLSIQFAPQ